jgi:hypothetical protein
MRDDKGLYYYPFPENKRVRMYVKQTEEIICFRMWNADDAQMWVQHGWVPYEAIRQASALFDKKDFDPDRAYDIRAARALLAESR